MAIFKSSTVKGDYKRSGSNNSGDGIYRMQYKPGDNLRLTFPILKDADGNPALIMLGEVEHRVATGFLKGTKRDGSKYNLYAIRCLNVLSQPSAEIQHELIHDHRFCPICRLNRWENRRTNEQMPENFSDLSKEDKKAFYTEANKYNKVESSSIKNADGSYRPDVSLYAMAFQFEVTETSEEVNGRTRRVQTPVLDDEGNATYKPVLVPLSTTRLDNMEMAVNSALDTGILGDSHLHSFSEGKDDEGNSLDNIIGWVDFMWQFPGGVSKQESGKKLMITVTPDAKSLVTDTLMNKAVAESAELIKKTNDSYYQMQPTMKILSLEDYFGYMDDGGKYYREMEAKFGYTEGNTPEGELTDDQYDEAARMMIDEGYSWADAKDALLNGTAKPADDSVKAEAPKAEAPKAESPKAEASKAEEPKAEEPKAEAPEATVEADSAEDDGFWD